MLAWRRTTTEDVAIGGSITCAESAVSAESDSLVISNRYSNKPRGGTGLLCGDGEHELVAGLHDDEFTRFFRNLKPGAG